MEVDGLGRTTKLTDPKGQVSYTVYKDPSHEVRTYVGWDSTAKLPTSPTQVQREDRPGGYFETLTMTATPHLDASNRPDGMESISNLQTLARQLTNKAGQVVNIDRYFDLTGLSYSTSVTLGSEWDPLAQTGNYYRSTVGYDERGR